MITLVWCTAIQAFRIVHSLYAAPRVLIVGVQTLWHLYGDVRLGAVQMCTAGIQKFHLRDTAPFGVLYCHAHFRNRIPIVRGAMGSPSLCTQAVVPVR